MILAQDMPKLNQFKSHFSRSKFSKYYRRISEKLFKNSANPWNVSVEDVGALVVLGNENNKLPQKSSISEAETYFFNVTILKDVDTNIDKLMTFRAPLEAFSLLLK